MRRMSSLQLCVLTTLLFAPLVGFLGYEGGRILEYRRALAAAEHTAAMLDGALGVCRAQREAQEHPAAERPVVGLTLG